MSEATNDGRNIVAVAKLLRHHRELKQRRGLFQSRQVDFFRYKRFVRALQSAEYAKKSQQQPALYPPVGTAEDAEAGARDVFIAMIRAQLVVPCVKLRSEECKEHGLKPSKDFPTLILSNKAVLQPDEYYVWNFNPKTVTDYLIVFGVIAAILALVCYPLWPMFMRRGSYYLSLGALGLLGVFFALAIVRLIIYLVSLPFTKNQGGFWIFPNLFEDCGVIDSFKPLYGYGEKECYSYLKKMKKNKRKLAKKKKVDESEDKEKQQSDTHEQ